MTVPGQLRPRARRRAAGAPAPPLTDRTGTSIRDRCSSGQSRRNAFMSGVASEVSR